MKKLIILMSLLLMTLILTGCKAKDVAQCPDPAILASLNFSHHVEQNYTGNKMTSESNGSVPLTIGTKGVNGNGTFSTQLSGSFPAGGCVISGTNSANVDVNGVCKDGMLELMLTETYSGGSITTTCTSGSMSAPIPSNTVSHELIMPLKHGQTVTKPFVGEAGSGNYNWTLNLTPGEDVEDEVEDEDNDVEPVPIS